jgi:cytochrome c peroxidase
MQYSPKTIRIFVICQLILASLFDPLSDQKGRAEDAAKNLSTPKSWFQITKGIPKDLWQKLIPPDNPLTAEKVALGESLYFDKRLSADGTVSCSTCHDPANAFTDHNVVAIGVSGKSGTRNAPTILNAMFSDRLFWDGRAGSLEEQAKQPLTNPFEMGMGSYDAVVARIAGIPEYRQRFQRVFRKRGITIDTIVKAIAAYERTQLSGNSPFDRFITGDQSAITKIQKRGWELFKGKAKCIECHSFSAASPFFTDFKFHNTGISVKGMDFKRIEGWVNQIKNSGYENLRNEPLSKTENLPPRARPTDMSASLLAHTEGFAELGRFLVTKQPKDVGAFKTPTLRDVELTTPYMHNGSEKTLLDVVKFYNRGGNTNPNLDERIRPLQLNDQEMNELVEFMRALTSDDVLLQSQQAIPQTRVPISLRPMKP